MLVKMRPYSQHNSFFSSLKQVEKRLKSENHSQSPCSQAPPTPPPPQTICTVNTTACTAESSLGSPMYLDLDQSKNPSTLQESEPPQAFISISPDLPQAELDQTQKHNHGQCSSQDVHEDPLDEIQQLIQLLGLSEESEYEETEANSCKCEGGFYDKIVGVKGPKCNKEVKRLDGWIKHFQRGGNEGCKEPLRLAHLLLGKAAFTSGEGLDFPSIIEEFLHADPPADG